MSKLDLDAIANLFNTQMHTDAFVIEMNNNLHALIAECRALRKAVAVRDSLLACYRCGKRPKEKLLDELAATAKWAE